VHVSIDTMAVDSSVASFDDTTRTDGSSFEADDVLAFLENNLQNVRDLCVSKLWNDDRLADLDDFLRSHHAALHLQALRLPNNGLTSRSSVNLANILSTTQTLRELDLSDNQVESQGLLALLPALTHETCALRRLDLYNNKLGATGATQIAAILRDNRSLRELRIGKNNLGRKKSLKAIATALQRNATLRTLDLSHNQIDDGGAILLAPVLDPEVSQSRLRRLDLTYNKIWPEGVRNLTGALLEGNRTLRCLNLSMNHVGPEGAESLAVLLKFSFTLQELLLSRNALGDHGVKLLCQGLDESKLLSGTGLQRLDLDWNEIHDDGAKELATMLLDNAILESLNLASNAIGSDGAKALANALHSNQALTFLNLMGNQIRDPGAFSLAENLCRPSCRVETLLWEKNNCLTPLGEERLIAAFDFRKNRRTWLGQILREIETCQSVNFNLLSCKLSDEEIMALAKHLAQYRPRVSTAYLGGHGVTARSMKVLAKDVLANNHVNLQRLHLQHTRVGDEGAGALAEALLSNSNLRTLTLFDCSISPEGAKLLAHTLAQNKSLTQLNLHKNAIGNRGAQELFTALVDPPHPSLVVLNLEQNEISDGALLQFQSFGRLQQLNIASNNFTDRAALDLAKACFNSLANGTLQLSWLTVSNNSISKKGLKALALFLPDGLVLENDGQLEAQTVLPIRSANGIDALYNKASLS
jgi:Ran GTPase-activating protein (RanGAP) involved in mRNA processing and transport